MIAGLVIISKETRFINVAPFLSFNFMVDFMDDCAGNSQFTDILLLALWVHQANHESILTTRFIL